MVRIRNALFANVLETSLFDDGGDVLSVVRCSSVEPLTFWMAAVVRELGCCSFRLAHLQLWLGSLECCYPWIWTSLLNWIGTVVDNWSWLAVHSSLLNRALTWLCHFLSPPSSSRLQKTTDLSPVVTLSHFRSFKLDVKQGSCPQFRNKEHVITR